MNTSRNPRKPGLLVILTLFVGVGMLATTLVQAAEPPADSNDRPATKSSGSTDWLQALWSIDLAGKLKSWKPKIHVDNGGSGIRLMRPFGVRGPALRVSNTIPLRSGEHRYSNAGNAYLDTYLFLEKRW
ncbi:MAG TPA: hypothetical protein ENK49_01370 [Gammaproteobacteria bacterium]|nr:hypothetical protein [Gammaproteobacteria bacterium]